MKKFLIGISILLTFVAFSFKASSIGHADKDKRPKINQEKLVKAHNALREAVGVPPIEWSVELADYAQMWADSLATSCSVFKSNGAYGENMYWTVSKRSEDEVVNFWAKEKKYFDKSDSTFSEEKGDMFEHYTQIIWKETTHVGAGRRKCDNGDEIWVCVYDPKGNKLGEKPF
ncbi:MAG: CAP domain-containing protein [Flavobacteriales bacterium]|nr:CAP domain-containing protein [Flavobacteriales bacterium]